MNPRQVRLSETWEAIGGPMARLGRSIREDRAAVLKPDDGKSSYDLLATDAFLQRFQQLTDLVLRKLFPRTLAVMESSDTRHPFGAVLDRLDGFEVVADVPWWIRLNEARNRLVHEYAMAPADRLEELTLAWGFAEQLHAEVIRIREDRDIGRKLFGHD